jgi:transmembrane sensor
MSEDIGAEAARWYAAQDSDDMDWEGFTVWLEADPRHRTAFDEVALIGDALDRGRDAIAARLPANEDQPVDAPQRATGRRWRLIGGGGIVASAMLAVALGLFQTPQPLVYASKGKQALPVALADGTRATLAPGSQLTVEGRNRDRLALQGSAYFDVPHLPERTLVIAAGALEVRDIGTRFAINRATTDVRIEVAEGHLSVTAPGLDKPMQLTAGQYADADLTSGTIRKGNFTPASVASWRSGQLRYTDAPLALVAADIARYGGKPVDVAPALRTRRFSGVLRISDGPKLATSLGAIMAIDVVEDGAGVHLRARP